MNRTVPVALACAALLAGCGALMPGAGPVATARLAPASGGTAAGTVRFERHQDRLMVAARVTGLRPNQEHGFHVHEKGDCSAPDFSSAGGHFNPDGRPHGHFGGTARHAGDLPNLRSDAQGVAEMRVPVTGLTVGGGTTDIVGRAVVVHAMPDDYASQPAGNSGARIACGTIAQG
jgi:Cu-Zn family superoxide dismutase